ncbi:sodium:alanine symporter family protein [Oribacterium sp. C9]|uniref:alanine/glycine:cation symporter family protein n=1 Tax=Oribacterium sp. C9 TaxID=1943579 RepID=UPI00098F26A9|nr:sodium:alanine symporter family protein [Oribacterium sp. C9]OON86633.1 sodium:alanine symporter family protein [Oribacterium sp. C9]
MELIYSISDSLNSFVWGVPTLVLLIGTGIFLTVRLDFLQFAQFGHIMKNTLGRLFERKKSQDGALTPIQALTTALAGTVGTGNIAGVAGAISLGGPGAIFWMWIAALFGMCTKYAEIILAVHYREVNEKGDYVGGPMYYIQNGLGKDWKWLGLIFSCFGAVAALGTGNMTQINTIATSIGAVVRSFYPEISGDDMQRIYMVIGIVGAVLTILVLFGGMQRIGNVTEKLVPVMACVYIIACIIVVVTHIGSLGYVFSMIIKGAFQPASISGGLVGVGIQQAAKAGFGRGIFSNEAGLGTAPIAHAAADVDHPVHQAMYGVFEVFMDTIVICTLTAVAVLISGCAEGFYGKSAGTDLTIMAFGVTFGSRMASIIIASCITLFACSTLLSWSLYGARCMEFIFGTKAILVYQAIYVMFVVVGATVQLSLVWQIADTANALMAVPNLIALLILSPKVVELTKEYFGKK